MSVKYVTIFVDDFTSRSLDYPNLSFYDYGKEESETGFDDWYYDYLYDFSGTIPFDFGDLDRSVTNFQNVGYYHSSQFSAASITDSGRTGPFFSDYYAPAQLYLIESYTDYITTYQLGTLDSSSEADAQHGDWVLDAFYSQLDNPDSVEVIAIDIDFINSNDFNYLFSNISGTDTSVFEAIYNDAVNRVYDSNNEYILSAFSASFTTQDYSVAQAVDEFINEQYAFVIQSAPNVTSPGISWGNYIDNVINVGAWNVDNNGYALASNINDIDVVDIYADGYVQNANWGNGWNFGTSFATPRVTAEIINFSDEFITPLILDDSLVLDPNLVMTNDEITSVTSGFVDSISTQMDVLFEELDYYIGPLNVMTDDLSNNLYPTAVPASIDDFGFKVENTIQSINNDPQPPTLNQAPTNIYLNDNTGPVSVTENLVGGFIANLSGYDPDDDALTYSVLPDHDGGMLEVSGSTLKFKDGIAADYEQGQVLHFLLRAEDPDGLSYDKEFYVDITNDPYDDNNYVVTKPIDINVSADGSDNPNNEVIESASSGTTVGITAFAEDQDLSNNTVTYSLTNNPNNLFAIHPNTGVVTVYGVLDYESSSSHNITITASSTDGSTDSSNFQINVLNDPSDDPPPPNNDPYFTDVVNSGDYPTFQENIPGGSVIAVYSASDDDGDNLTFSITGGADQSYFTIETIQNDYGYIGRVKVKEYGQPDFDTLKDTYQIKTDIPNNPGEYVILDLEISVSDGNSVVSRTINPALFNNVFDDPQPPTLNQAPTNIYLNDNTGPVSVTENLVGGFIANLSGYDPDDDALTYSVLPDHDGGMLEVSGSTLKFKDGIAADYEQGQVLHFLLRAEDPDGLSYDKEFYVDITNDPYDDNNYVVTKPIDINVSADGSDNPNNEVIESASSGTTVGITAFAEDQDLSNNTVTYSLTNNPNNLFAIHPNTGVVTVYGVLDYESSSSHNITITASSTDGSTDSSNFQINVLNDPSDDPPPPNNDPYFTDVVNSGDYPTFQENIPGGSVIAVYSASDDDGDNLTFSITGGADQSYFTIETIQNDYGYIGRVKVKEYGQPDFDTLKDTYQIKTDIPNNPGEYVILDLEISVSDGNSVVSRTINPALFNNVFDDPQPPTLNQAPTNIYLNDNTGPVSVTENLVGGFIANLSGYDPDDDALTYSVLPDHDGGMLEVSGSTLKFKDGIAADYEQGQVLHFLLRAEDPDGLSYDKEFYVDITNDPYDDNNYVVTKPIDINVSADGSDNPNNEVIESASSGTTVGITAFAEDQDLSNNTVTYSLTNNPNNLFAIHPNTGVVTVYGVLDYESSSSHNITITASSTDGSTDSSNFQINVLNDPNDTDNNINEPPTSISLDNLIVNENIAGAHIANISGIDPDDDQLSFELLYTWHRDNLEISGNVLKLKDDFSIDYEAPNGNYENLIVNVRASDPHGLYTDQMFEVEVIDDPSDNYTPLAPTDILLDNTNVYENRAGEEIANISGIDPNEDDLTFVVFQSRDGVKLEIKDNILKLKDGIILDYDQDSNLNFFIRAEDTTGLTYVKEFNVAVLENDVPLELPDNFIFFGHDFTNEIYDTTGLTAINFLTDGDTSNEGLFALEQRGDDWNSWFFHELIDNDGDKSLVLGQEYQLKASVQMPGWIEGLKIDHSEYTFLDLDDSDPLVTTTHNTAPNQSPTSLNIEEMAVYENIIGAELGLISAYDPDGDQLNFELSGYNSHHFDLIPYEGPAITLHGWQGVTLKLNDNWSYDYETLVNYVDRTLTIKVTDPEGLFIEENFEYQILDDPSDNPVVIDTTPPVLTNFEIVDNTLLVDEQFVINFNATDDSALRRYNGEFTYIDDTGSQHNLQFSGTPILMEDGSYNTYGRTIPTDYPSGDYALTRFFIEDVNNNEYWRDSSEPFWNDINTTITVTNPNDVDIDTTPPVLTNFEIVDATLSVDEQFVINFNATDDSALRRYSGEFTYIDDTGSQHNLQFSGTPILMEDGSYNTYGRTIPTDYPSGDYALTRFFIEDVNNNEYWRVSSEPFWDDINTTITVTNPNDTDNNINEPPTSISLDNLNVNENIAGAHIANISGIDPENDELTFFIVEGLGDHNMFIIMNNMLHLKADIAADYENSEQLDVTLRVKDSEDLSKDQSFTINVINDLSDDHVDNYSESTKSILIYNHRVPIEGYSISTPNNKDIFAVLIDNETGQVLSDKTDISSEIGIEIVKDIRATEDGGFTILYNASDYKYVESTNRFEYSNKAIFKEFDNNLNLVSSYSAPDDRSTDTSNMSYKYDNEAVYLNDLAFYKDVNEEHSEIQRIGVYDFSEGTTEYIEWTTDGLGTDLKFNHILESDNSKSILIYNHRVPIEGYSISTPNNKDIFAVLIDNETGQVLSDKTDISSEIGIEIVKDIRATEDGGFTILYNASDYKYVESTNRFEYSNKAIFKEFDNNLNLVSSYSAPDDRSTDTSNMSYKYDNEAVYLNDLAFYKDVNEEHSEIQRIGVYDFSEGTTEYIEWTTDGLGTDLKFNHILESDNSKSILIYNHRVPIEGYSISTPNNKDIFAVLIDNETGQVLSDKTDISSEIGIEIVKDIRATEDGGFTILYNASDYKYVESTNRFEYSNKAIFKEFDNNLNLVSSYSAPDDRSTDTSNMSYKYDNEAVYLNDLAFYKDVNEEHSEIQRIGVYDFSEGTTEYIEWTTDGLGTDLKFNHILELNEVSVSFTASIDKWAGGVSDWLDGPVMKLHSKDNDVISPVGIDLSMKDGHPGHKHKPDMDKGTYELRVEHNQNTDGAINIDDVMGVLSLSRGISQTTSEEHKLAADWNSDGLINIDDVMGVLSRSRGIEKNDEWRFYDKGNDKSLWDNASKMNKMDIVLEDDKDIELSAILRGDVNASYKADQHDRPDPSPAPTSNLAPLPLNNDDELLTINPDIL